MTSAFDAAIQAAGVDWVPSSCATSRMGLPSFQAPGIESNSLLFDYTATWRHPVQRFAVRSGLSSLPWMQVFELFFGGVCHVRAFRLLLKEGYCSASIYTEAP